MNPNIPQTDRKRVVIVGAGFGGLKLARALSRRNEFQVVLLNRQNYHEFQPLYYQVATAGLEANSILFPLRAVFGDCKNVNLRITNVTGVRQADKAVDYGFVAETMADIRAAGIFNIGLVTVPKQ